MNISEIEKMKPSKKQENKKLRLTKNSKGNFSILVILFRLPIKKRQNKLAVRHTYCPIVYIIYHNNLPRN